ncbi:MAG: hypothetical protein E6K97_10335 [Thaumarchaeota archaeon]|nr:MAG: hypothetical protein E6K97_10335 [Nitrososphaerota archaeon]
MIRRYALLSSLALAILTPVLFSSATQYSNAQGSEGTVVRDSQTVLLEGKTLPSKDYVHLYDATPYMIKVGHIAAKLPCDNNNKTSLNVLIGQAPKFKPANLELLKELSTPGKMCIYHVDVESTKQVNGTITDIALQNPTNKEVKFGPTATIVIGVDEIMPGAEAESMGNMSMGNSTG